MRRISCTALITIALLAGCGHSSQPTAPGHEAERPAHAGVLHSRGGIPATVLSVPRDHPTIQAAVDAAVPGTHIFVSPGTYDENVVISGHSNVLLQAVGHVLVRASSGDGVFEVAESEDIGIDNFTIEVQKNGLEPFPVYVWDSPRTRITRNRIVGRLSVGGEAPQLGMVVRASSGSQIQHNHLSMFRNGVFVLSGEGHSIRDNVVEGGSGQELDGIFITAVANATVEHNAVHGFGQGIVLSRTTGCAVAHNVCANGRTGMRLLRADANTIGPQNVCEGNHDHGIWLTVGSDDNLVKQNHFLENGTMSVGFDILNDGLGNVFFNNKATTTSGLNALAEPGRYRESDSAD